MTFRRLVSVFCFLFAAAASGRQVNHGPPSQSEQVEVGMAPAQAEQHLGVTPRSGVMESPMRSYRIRLLPVSSFPELPMDVAQQLDRLGCMVPQSYEARGPENVIHGAFEKKGSEDWAALCSVKGVTTLYVFFESAPDVPIALRHQPDTEWLGTEAVWVHDYGSAWGITTRPARLMESTDKADHDGIEDAYLEQSGTIHYFRDGHWTTFDGTE